MYTPANGAAVPDLTVFYLFIIIDRFIVESGRLNYVEIYLLHAYRQTPMTSCMKEPLLWFF